MKPELRENRPLFQLRPDFQKRLKRMRKRWARYYREETYDTVREKARIALWTFAVSDPCETGVIIRWSTGIVWSHQAGGGLCLHPAMEGFFLPINMSPKIKDRLHQALCGPILRKIHLSEIQNIQHLISKLGPFKLDRLRLGFLQEAWIPIKIVKERKPKSNHDYSAWEKLIGRRGALIYNNCD